MRRGLFDSIGSALLYEESTSPLHSLDPRSKLLYAVLTIVGAMAINSTIVLLLILMVNLILLALHRNLIIKFVLLLRGLAIFIVMIVAFNILVTLAFTKISIADAIWLQVKSVVRVVCVAIAILILLTTSTPWQIIQAFTKMGVPYTYVYPFIIALRFIPIVFTEMKNIYDAQRARGLEFEKGRLLERIRRAAAIIIPTIVCSVIRAKDLIEAMELRGFGYRRKRTFYKSIKFRMVDIVFTVVISAVYLTAIAVTLLY